MCSLGLGLHPLGYPGRREELLPYGSRHTEALVVDHRKMRLLRIQLLRLRRSGVRRWLRAYGRRLCSLGCSRLRWYAAAGLGTLWRVSLAGWRRASLLQRGCTLSGLRSLREG